MYIVYSSVELGKAIVPVDCSEAKDGTLENLLIWGRNKKNNVSFYLNTCLFTQFGQLVFYLIYTHFIVHDLQLQSDDQQC